MADQWAPLVKTVMDGGKVASIAIAGEDNQFFVAQNAKKTKADAASFDLWWKDSHKEKVETEKGAKEFTIDEVACVAAMKAFTKDTKAPESGLWLGGKKYMFQMQDELEGFKCAQFAQHGEKQTGVFLVQVPESKVTVAVRYAQPLEFQAGSAKAALIDFCASLKA